MKHDDVEIAPAALDGYSDGIAGAKEHQIDRCVSDHDVADFDFVEKCRQDRTRQDDLFFDGVNVETDGGLKKKKRRASGPCLRGARDGIRARSLAGAPSEAAEELGQTDEVERSGRLK